MSEYEQWFADWGLTPETANQVLRNYSAFLSAMTGGKLSKICYDLKVMEEAAKDYWDLRYHLTDYVPRLLIFDELKTISGTARLLVGEAFQQPSKGDGMVEWLM